jgi:hypothetical protein
MWSGWKRILINLIVLAVSGDSVMKSNLAIVSVILAFAVSSFVAPAPSGVKHYTLPSDTAAIALIPVENCGGQYSEVRFHN